MLKSFLLISIRNILKNKGGSYLNLIGLTLGMGACLYIYNYLSFEFSYDQFDDDREVFRVETHSYHDGMSAFTTPLTATSTSDYFKTNVFARLIPFSEEGSALFRYTQEDQKEKKVYIETAYFADSSLFQVFPLQLIEGQVSTEPNTIVLSKSTVAALFPNESESAIIGRKLQSAGTGTLNQQYIVSGIFSDLPANTHLKFNALVSIHSPAAGLNNPEIQKAGNTYAYLLNPVIKPEHLSPPVPDQIKLFLRPVDQIHLESGISNEPTANISKPLLIFLGVIGIIILILACTNYINNTIVNSIYRAREIGIRKLLGAKQPQLVLTFIGEAFMVNMVSGILSLLLVNWGVKLVSSFVQVDSSFQILTENFQGQLIFVSIMVVICSLLSSLYPAFYLTSLNPIATLRNKITTSGSDKTGAVIKSLLVFQLCISVIFLSAVYVVHRQLTYLEKQETAPFELQITGIFPGSSMAGPVFNQQAIGFINQLKKGELIYRAEFSNLRNGSLKTAQQVELLHPKDALFNPAKNTFDLKVIDASYLEKDEYTFIRGENFSPIFGSDHQNIILNVAALETLGFNNPDSLQGKLLRTKGGNMNVIGIVSENNGPAPPSVYVTGFRYLTYLDLTLNYPGNAGENVNLFIEKTENLLTSRLPFLYLFDRAYQQQRNLENGMLGIFSFFSFLAIFISSIGMFGLSLFITQKRTREIGIRKVLGAKSESILLILLKDFLKLIALASVLALPIVLTGSKIWLENYIYRISIDPSIVGLPILVILGISLMVIIEKCWRVARLNPIHSIKSD